MKETLKREIQIQKQLKHVNIVRLYTSLEDERYIYLILEYVKQGNLFFIIRKKRSCIGLSKPYIFSMR